MHDQQNIKLCNAGVMIVITDWNMYLYLTKDKWLCLTDK
jgi:hypothetical protein